MTPGTILFDPNFQFKDGKLGEKYFVVLNDGSCGIYIAVKVTSRGRRYGIQHGCQVMERYPNFLLTKGCCCLPKSTWIQLDAFYEFKSSTLMEKAMTGQIHRQGLLSDSITKDLLVCTTNAEDISDFQEEIVQASLKSITPSTVTTG